MSTSLAAPVSPGEIKRAVFQIATTQEPESGGFTGVLFRSYWDIVGEDVVLAVSSFFESGSLLKNFNHTWLVLAPKVDVVETMKQLRPISLYQFVYKIIAKILVERLTHFLPSIVSPG
ncbi:unnamed protein product [Linum trigynum]|uniref:Reverse transcriptase n=1 Tax=Linum trigynum TaxID=586398 RepID=A0AAV2GCX7_9ROSI